MLQYAAAHRQLVCTKKSPATSDNVLVNISWRIFGSRLAMLAGAALSGFYPEAGSILATAPGILDAFQGRSVNRDAVGEAFSRAERLDVYLAFERSVLGAFAHASFILGRKPPKLPNVWYLASTWRATRRLQDASAAGIVAIAGVHLMAPGKVFDASRQVALALGEGLRSMGEQKLGSAAARAVVAEVGERLGSTLNGLRDAVAEDLATGLGE